MKKYSAVWDDQTYVYVGTAEEVMNLYLYCGTRRWNDSLGEFCGVL